MRAVPRRFYRRDAAEVAPELLNKLLVVGERSGRIVEVEAYRGSEDPGSHAFRGRTGRNAVMFGPPGLLYVYFSYGMHWCANAVCQRDGVPHAVLIRALAPVTGLEEMRSARMAGVAGAGGTVAGPAAGVGAGGPGGAEVGAGGPGGAEARVGEAAYEGAGLGGTTGRPGRRVADRDLCRGPGRLCRALGITGQLNGADLVTGNRGVRIADDGVDPPELPGVSVRIGLTKGAEHPWRYFVPGDRHLSRPG